MRKIFFLLIILVSVLIISGCETTKRHTCYYDSETLNITCSPELRIQIGYERIFEEGTDFEPDNPGIQWYYDEPIYTETPNSNVGEIWAGFVNSMNSGTAQPPEDPTIFYTSYSHAGSRNINVKDVETGETFIFYVSNSGPYDVTVPRTSYYQAFVCSFNENTVCMPEQHWRCWNYDTTAKACDAVVASISRGDVPIERCYDLSKHDLITYCFANTDMQKCVEYSNQETCEELVN